MKAIAKLKNVPTSPRKMRLVADLVRGKGVFHAMSILKYQPQHAARDMEKVLRSAIANWEQKNPEAPVEDLVVKTILVDCGRMMKRVLPASRGRAFRVRKRSNHITIEVDTLAPMLDLSNAATAPELTQENQ